MRRRISQRLDDLQLLEDRARARTGAHRVSSAGRFAGNARLADGPRGQQPADRRHEE